MPPRKKQTPKLTSLMWIILLIMLLPLVLAIYQVLYKHGVIPPPAEPVQKFIDMIVPYLIPIALIAIGVPLLATPAFWLGVFFLVCAFVSIGYVSWTTFFKDDATEPPVTVGPNTGILN